MNVDDEGDPLVVHSDRQRSTVIVDLMEEISVLEPLEQSVLEVSLEGGDSSIIEVACAEVISFLEPLEHSVLEVSIEGGDSLIVEVAMSDPLEHSGVGRAPDVVSGLLLPEPLEHSVLVVPMEVGDGSVADITVLDPLEHLDVSMLADTVSTYLPGCTRRIPGMEEVVCGTIGV